MRLLNRPSMAAVSLAIVAFIAPSGAASATYSPSITVSSSVSGDRVTATVSSDVTCISWEASPVDFEGETKTLPGGKSAQVTFDAPDDEGTYHIRFVCTYDDLKALAPIDRGTTGDTVFLVPAAIQTVTTVAAFSVRDGDDDDDSDDSDDSDDGSGGLPGTGGPHQELLWIGIALLGAGSAAIYSVRRRNANA